jgi:diadenosine tetraphosphate (Ap4A) HIT family hydrolase
MMDDCIFCKIVKGEIPSFKIWEDEKHIAFLDIRPIVPGMTLVIPKEHHGSYVMKEDLPVVCDLMGAVQKVANILDAKLENVIQTNLIFEGVEVPHLHAKLLPMYRGAIAIEGVGERASDEGLARIAEKLRS